MSYFEIEIQVNNEGTESKGIYSYDNKDDAEIVFHQKVASGMTAIKNGTLKSALNLVINGMGGTELSDYKEKQEVQE
jgi:Na+-transporting NADH:ubiquinone oxidoreductase subunit NqrA